MATDLIAMTAGIPAIHGVVIDPGKLEAFICFVLHEIPPNEQEQLVKDLASKLLPDGKVYVREPLRFISREVIQGIMQSVRLVEIGAMEYAVQKQGRVFEGVYQKSTYIS